MVATFRMIYENEHTPVDQPGALLQCFDVTEIITHEINIVIFINFAIIECT